MAHGQADSHGDQISLQAWFSCRFAHSELEHVPAFEENWCLFPSSVCAMDPQLLPLCHGRKPGHMPGLFLASSPLPQLLCSPCSHLLLWYGWALLALFTLLAQTLPVHVHVGSSSAFASAAVVSKAHTESWACIVKLASPLCRWPGEDMETALVHLDRQLPLLL